MDTNGHVRTCERSNAYFTAHTCATWVPNVRFTVPLGALNVLDTTKVVEFHRGVVCVLAGPVQPALTVYGLFVISKSARAPKLLMHALGLYGPYGKAKIVRAVRTPCWDVRFLFKTARELTGNTPPLTGLEV